MNGPAHRLVASPDAAPAHHKLHKGEQSTALRFAAGALARFAPNFQTSRSQRPRQKHQKKLT